MTISLRKTDVTRLTLSALFLALALALPFLTGQIPQLGSALLPMHLPVLLCGMTLTALYDGLSAANNIDSKKAHGLVVKNSKTMYYGCRGDNVKSLQKLLKKAGFFKGTADGKYGDLTLSAVKRFQWSVGLSGDGLAGTKTLDALKKAVKSK